jgi:isopentenyl diphosphate isomerase/L-lactate dehydrogenase-like FMN-dependent dehydrogenase
LGCEGIVVTNHAGRQVDGAIGSLEVLPEIVAAVGDSMLIIPLSFFAGFTNLIVTEMTIIFDSGIRTGADVFKAIALGAHVVMVGRLYVWGMSHEGEHGCRHVMKSLLAVSLQILTINCNYLTGFISSGSRYNDDRCGLPIDYRRSAWKGEGSSAV